MQHILTIRAKAIVVSLFCMLVIFSSRAAVSSVLNALEYNSIVNEKNTVSRDVVGSRAPSTRYDVVENGSGHKTQSLNNSFESKADVNVCNPSDASCIFSKYGTTTAMPKMVKKQFEWVPAEVYVGENTAFHWNIENAETCFATTHGTNAPLERSSVGQTVNHVYAAPEIYTTKWYCKDKYGNRFPEDTTQFLEAVRTVKAVPKMMKKQFEWIPKNVKVGEHTAFYWEIENAETCFATTHGANAPLERGSVGKTVSHIYAAPEIYTTKWYCKDKYGNRFPEDTTKFLEAVRTVVAGEQTWLNLSRTPVSDAVGVDIEPSESIDLSTASIKGQAGVSGGQASYQIPIDLPPGRNGVQPSVSLSYNSQGGNGILGVGWSLNAGSSISRCGATFAQDGFTRAVTFSATTDRLCLDGQRLIAITGTYGTGNTEYRTEMDSFVKVVQHGNINDSNSSFTVYKPDGNSAIYGANANSRFVPNGLSTALSWKVTQESYSNGANTIDYEYDGSTVGENLLSKIYYTGNNSRKGDRYVSFIYEPRGDIKSSYINGGEFSLEQRLSSIQVFKSLQGEIVRTYQVDYETSKASNNSLVTGINSCGYISGIAQCTPISKFFWHNSQNVSDALPLKIGGENVFSGNVKIQSVVPHGDLDGNGSRDFVGYFTDAEQSMLGSNGGDVNQSCHKPYDAYGFRCIEMDLDLDGINDAHKFINNILYVDYSSDNFGFISTGVKLDVIPTNPLITSIEKIKAVEDFDGDGWPDLLVYKNSNEMNHRLELYLHSKNKYSPYGSSILVKKLGQELNHDTGRYFTRNDIDVIGDIDGNGLPDLLEVTLSNIQFSVPSGYPTSFLINNSLPGVLSFTTRGAPRGDSNVTGVDLQFFNYFIDVNGDGLADFLSWERGRSQLRINTGNGFSDPFDLGLDAELSKRSFQIMNSAGVVMKISVPKFFDALKIIDVDSDGKNELLIPANRIITGCSKVYDPKLGNRDLCGDQLYGSVRVSSGSDYPSQLIDASQNDDSIYQYDAISFVKQSDGSYIAQRKSTSLIGSAYQMIAMDAFGDGLIDSVFAYGPRSDSDNWIKDPQFSSLGNRYGIYISRNYGSGNGLNTNSYEPIDYLKQIIDGQDNITEWRYRPLSTGESSAGQPQLYSADHDEIGSGYVHFASSMYVVQSFKQSNGQGGENETQYAYKGAMYNLQGRGFTGFNQIWEKDMQRDKTVHSIFEQKFPRVGLLTSQTVSVGSAPVNQVNNTWVDNPQHSISKVFHNIQTSSVQRSWDISGTTLSTQESLVNASDVDAWGNIKKHTQKLTDYIKGQANTYTNTTETSFAVDTNNWWLNKFNETRTSHDTVQRAWGDDPVGTNDKAQWQLQTVNTWDNVHKLPTQVTYTASNTSCNRVEQTGLNSYGLPLWTKSTGQSSACTAITARQNNFTYTKDGKTQVDDGYLPYKVTNAKGHITTTEYDMGLGLPTKVVVPNNIVTQTEYDGIGRPVQVQQTGSPTRYLRYLLANEGNNAPQDNDNVPVVMTRTSGAGMPESEQYFDGQGRLLRTATQGFDGGYQYQDKHYDALGRMTRDSTPYGNGTAADYTEFSDFDALDRPSRRTIPNGRSGGLESIYTYNGLTTNINVEGRTMSRTYGSQGWLYETVDAQDGTNRFAYDGAGRPLVIRDANNRDIKATYNGFGHKTQVIDPNQGTTVFGYNTLGELDKQTDANGVVQTYVLDVLGRITSKTTTGGSAPGTATFVWDTIKQGMLTSETENGVTRNYSYTAALQLAQTTIAVDGVSRTVKHQYDGFYGRPKALEYPNGLTLKYGYNDYGYLEQTSNAASGYLYRQITAMDEAGHITGANLANRVMSESRVYYSEGTMSSVEVDGPLGLIHGHYYDGYDDFMNLTSERNGVTGLVKSYRYDSLNRLEEYQFNNTNPNFTATVNYAYDKVGNFLKKTDYSANATNAYRYGGNAGCAANSNAGPNAVCQLNKLNGSTVNFQYDKRGNLRVGDGLTMTYNAMDKPLTISGRGPNNNTLTAFMYGSDSMRAKQSRTVSGSTTTTYYVDKYYEIDNDGSWRAYLDDIAVLSYTPQRSHLLQFTLRDRLGSATTMADQNGNIVSQRYFDPFGRTTDLGYNHKLDIQNTNTLLSQLQDLVVTNKNRRGFTDHEHLNEQQLIHMNGRIYDYNLGRFMSVDPLIQSSTSTQSVNPYSYIMNNPLAGTDPTGYQSLQWDGSTKVKTDSCDVGCSRVFFGPVGKSNGASGSSNTKSQSKNVADIGSSQQNAVKQNPSYGNDPRFVEGYASIEADMSGIMSLTPIGQAVDSIKSDIEGVETALDEYNRTGSIAGAAWAGTAIALEKYVEHKLKVGRGPDVVTGGPHGKVKGIPGNESHHMPADSVSPLAKDKGPAISMEKGEHRQTASWGNSREARAYRSQQAQLIQRGDFKGAQQMDINDVRSKFGEKYDNAINQMLDYSKTLD